MILVAFWNQTHYIHATNGFPSNKIHTCIDVERPARRILCVQQHKETLSSTVCISGNDEVMICYVWFHCCFNVKIRKRAQMRLSWWCCWWWCERENLFARLLDFLQCEKKLGRPLSLSINVNWAHLAKPKTIHTLTHTRIYAATEALEWKHCWKLYAWTLKLAIFLKMRYAKMLCLRNAVLHIK